VRRWLWLVGVLLVVLAAPAGTVGSGCGEPLREPRFGEAATAQSLQGVVESETIAANPLPWGRSVSAVTRVWGGVTVERLVVGQRRFVECPVHPSDPAGTVRYRFVGLRLDGVGTELVLASRASADALSPLETSLGEAVEFEATGFDRSMAVVQAWLWELTIAVVVLLAAVQIVFVLRRRGRERADYLF
jgi:hypothetical protein